VAALALALACAPAPDSDPGLGTGTVVSTGPFVAGVHGDLAPGEQNRLLEELVSRLEAGL